MHRIDGAAPAIAVPTPAAVGATVGYFTEGNPTLGVEATEVTADWLNGVQEELAYVIEQAGGTLDKTVRTQLKTAIDQMIGAKGFDINNLGFAATVATNALTFSLKTKAGNAPSASDPVRLGFRNATLTTGQYAIRSVTSALTLVISSGSTLGHGSAVNEWVYLYALDNAGTVELAASSTLYPDNTIQSTTAEGGAGAADARTTIYSTTARTSVPIRLIGRIKSNQTAAGTYASSPTELSLAPFADPVSFSRELSNVGIACAVGSSALTVSLKDRLGSDPSSNSPVKVGFRSSTAATGTYRQNVVTGALSVVISSGSTLGHASTIESNIYVYLIDATDLGGGVELAVSTKLFDDGSVQTVTAEGGAGAADSETVLYGTTARVGVPIRLIGRLKSTQVTAGTWALVPTEIALEFDKAIQRNLKIVSKTGAYTAQIADDLIFCSGAAFAVTMPLAADCPGKRIRIRKTDSSFTNIITPTRAGADTFTDNVASLTTTTLNTLGEEVELISDGVSVWHITRNIPSVWTSYTPTGAWNTNVTYTGQWKRMGDSIIVRIQATLSGAPNAASFTASIPSGLTFDTAKLTASFPPYMNFGSGSTLCAGVARGPIQAGYNDTSSFTAWTLANSAASGHDFSAVNATSPATYANGDFVLLNAIMPISGWKG